MIRAGMVITSIVLLYVSFFTAHRAEAFSLQTFVATLLAQGIISTEKESVARMLAQYFDSIRASDAGVIITSARPNKEHVRIQASQLIEHARRIYAEGEDIRGLLLNVRNAHVEPIELRGRARCHVSYRILRADDRVQVYNSAEHAPCTSNEISSYTLGSNDIRMFEIRHSQKKFPLSAGEYMFVMEYPGYGSGELEVVIK